MAILGLVSTESVSSQRWTNIRRRVFYQYPNGSAPLIGILSMMKEESTNDPEFSWWEKRLLEQVTTTVVMNAGGPFGKTSTAYTTDLNGTSDTIAFSATAPVTYGLAVTDATLFRPGHIIKIVGVTAYSTAYVYDIVGRVTAVSATGNGNSGPFLTFTVISIVRTATGGQAASMIPLNGASGVGLTVQVVGSAFPQGVTDLSSEVYYLPINPGNYTQIFRTPFSFTGNALVTPVKFDDTGVYKDKAKSHSIDHMVEQEMAVIFGQKSKTVPTGTAAPTTGVGLPIYTMGGILWFLQQWECPSNNYPVTTTGYGNTAATADTDDNKRIIANTGGTMNEATYDGYLERLFRTTSNVSNEKLVLCGSGFLKVMNQMYRSQSTFVYYPPSGDTFGMEIVAHKTAFGTVYYKTHPLFSRNAALRNNALFLDVHNLRYRPMDKRDTQLSKNRQPNDADYRKDEWFTEFGLELRMPESFMYIQNVTSYVP